MISPLDRLTAALADRYRLDRELGAGGMATVYLAHDLKHQRDVAIKVLHPDLGAALGGERFLSEIRTTARLQHPHILPLLESGEADGLLYYVMPLVTGETLRARMERERQLPIACARGGQCARLRTPTERHSPRHQAGEHPPAGWLRGRGRLRHRAGGAKRRWSAHDANRIEPWHAAVHESRAAADG